MSIPEPTPLDDRERRPKPSSGDRVVPTSPDRSPERAGARQRLVGLYRIAQAQKMVIWAFLAGLLAVAVYLQVGDTPVAVAAWVAAAIFQLVAVLRLQVAMENSVVAAIVLALFMLAPCLNLILLVVLMTQATAALRRGGIRVGLFGAKMGDFSDL